MSSRSLALLPSQLPSVQSRPKGAASSSCRCHPWMLSRRRRLWSSRWLPSTNTKPHQRDVFTSPKNPKKTLRFLLSFNSFFSLVFFNLSSHGADRGKKRKPRIWKRRGGSWKIREDITRRRKKSCSKRRTRMVLLLQLCIATRKLDPQYVGLQMMCQQQLLYTFKTRTGLMTAASQFTTSKLSQPRT
ncbi:hypothetical protein BRADI_2g56713v3 [Brachypodium distachyon]|uniref:Uncharacterized protein n=1 Tax=Brachypodium distachyon TaxID=15368 RepID=A0A0Q3GKC8_BRADI|nr:hypothetical protein BRADI_2g56713v3 [Brachypodium distachyon]